LDEQRVIFSVFILFSEITQVFLECILCRKAGVGQVSFFTTSRLQPAIIEYFYAAINNERHNTKAMVEKQERCFIDI